MMKRFDLHCHTIYSDGSLSPKELINKAREQNLSGISITDHDTFQGYFEAKNEGIPIIPGVEISADFEGHSIHILGYAFDPTDAAFYDFCLTQRIRRKERNRQMLKKLSELGMNVAESDVVDSADPNRTYGRVHIALQLLKKGYVKDLLEAFKLYIGNRCPCYVSGEKWSVEEAIKAIHKAKGLAVLAHPHIIKSKSLSRRLLELPFDGLEAYYGRFPANENEHWVEMANKRGLFVTGGSDFHGLAKPDVALGAAFTPESTFEKLQKHFDELSRLP